MSASTFSVLNNAKNKLVEGDPFAAESFYGRAVSEGIPSAIIDLHKITKGYMLLSMSEYSPIVYFECLKKIRKLADSSEIYRKEYEVALGTLKNIKDMFLRDVAVNYFSEVCTSSWQSNYGRSLDDMYIYLEGYIDEITDKDCYALATYAPDVDLGKLRRDLLTVEAYSLNVLLMYVAYKSTNYEGKTYYANTVDFGDYALVQVNSHDNYSHNAAIMPRLHHIGKDAYYDDYLADLKKISAKLNISTADELKTQVGRLVDLKDAKNDAEKAYYDYAKKIAKDDIGRRSFFNTFGAFNPFYFMVKPILKVCVGAEEVGSFDTETVFTRKRWLGVCNMLAWANDWSVEMVRTMMFIAGCFCGLGLIAYLGLYLAMKSGFYLPNLSVQKH